jgi:hypothetical protein
MAAKEVIYFQLAAQLPHAFQPRIAIPFRTNVGISSQLDHHGRCALGRDWTLVDPESSTRGG